MNKTLLTIALAATLAHTTPSHASDDLVSKDMLLFPLYIGGAIVGGAAYGAYMVLELPVTMATDISIGSLRVMSSPIRSLLVDRGDTSTLAEPPLGNTSQLIVKNEDFTALNKNGALVHWGSNNLQLFDPANTTELAHPVVVPGTHGIVEIAAGDSHMLARRADGSVWSWGANHALQLGYIAEALEAGKDRCLIRDGIQTTPKAVSIMGQAISIAARGNASFVLNDEGSLYAFGDYSSSTPTSCTGQIGRLPRILTNVSHGQKLYAGENILAVTTDDNHLQLLTFNLTGKNNLSNGGDVHFPAPVMDIGITGKTMTALLADGSVWTYGDNQQGQLGQGDYFYTKGINKVKNIGHIISLACNNLRCSALDDQGRIWQWGDKLDFRTWWSNKTQRFYNPYPAVVLQKKGLTAIKADGQKLYGVTADNTVSVLAN